MDVGFMESNTLCPRATLHEKATYERSRVMRSRTRQDGIDTEWVLQKSKSLLHIWLNLQVKTRLLLLLGIMCFVTIRAICDNFQLWRSAFIPNSTVFSAPLGKVSYFISACVKCRIFAIQCVALVSWLVSVECHRSSGQDSKSMCFLNCKN